MTGWVVSTLLALSCADLLQLRPLHGLREAGRRGTLLRDEARGELHVHNPSLEVLTSCRTLHGNSCKRDVSWLTLTPPRSRNDRVRRAERRQEERGT